MNEGNKKNALKAGLWYTVSNFIVKGTTFLSMPIFARVMTVNDIGDFSNIASWFNILSIIVTFDLFTSVMLAKYDFKNDFNKYISSNLILGSIITLFFYIIVLIFKDFFLKLFSMNFLTLNILFIYLIFYPSIQMFQVKNRIEYKYILSTLVSIGSSFVSIVISLICVLMFKDAIIGRVIGYYIPLIIISVIIYFILIFKGKCISNVKKYWKYSILISFPLMWHTLAINILGSSDRIMISNILGKDKTALYTVAYTCALVVSLLWSSMNNAWSPWAFEMMSKKEYDKMRSSSKPYLIFFLIIVYCFMFFAPELLLIVGGKNYIEAVYVIPPVMIGYVFQAVYSFYINIEIYNKKQLNIAFGTIIAALINIVLNLIFIPKFGYIAAAYTTLFSYMILFVIHFGFVNKMKKNYYNTNFFFKVLFISLVSILPMNLLYNNTIVRYMFMVSFIITIIIIFRKKISKVLYYLKKGDFKCLKKSFMVMLNDI